jgi:DegV family protein with EDD domain
MKFEIITDSSANLTDTLIEKYDLKIISLSYFIGEEEYLSYKEGVKTDYSEFYARIRKKEEARTSLANYEECMRVLRPIAESGRDILYIGFSSALSGTFQNVSNCMQELRTKHPDQKMLCVDSLSASMGEGLLVYHALELAQRGATIEETLEWVENHKMNICQWFTVDDLFFLKRGGRLSGAAALAGSLLEIKPILHIDEEGRLVMVSKVKGRKKSLNALVQHMEETVVKIKPQKIFIAHGDCLEDAQYLADGIKAKLGLEDIEINYVDPVIGVHSGPGTIALFYYGKTR